MESRRFRKVDGQPDLARDMLSGAVVSLNTREFDKFMDEKRRRDALIAMKSRQEAIEARLERIEELLSKLVGA